MREQGCGPSPSAPRASLAGRCGSEGLWALERCIARWGPHAAPLFLTAFMHQEASELLQVLSLSAQPGRSAWLLGAGGS